MWSRFSPNRPSSFVRIRLSNEPVLSTLTLFPVYATSVLAPGLSLVVWQVSQRNFVSCQSVPVCGHGTNPMGSTRQGQTTTPANMVKVVMMSSSYIVRADVRSFHGMAFVKTVQRIYECGGLPAFYPGLPTGLIDVSLQWN